MSYRVFSVRGRPLLATPSAPRRLRLAAMDRLRPASRRRQAYHRAVRLAMRLGLDGLLSRDVEQPVGGLAGHLRELGLLLDEPDLTAAVGWPAELHRGRVYLHLFDRASRPVGFVKLSLDADNDERLKREASLLAELSQHRFQRMRVPAVLDCGRIDGRVVVVTEPLPDDARPLPERLDAYPAECVEAFAGAPLPAPVGASGLSWWNRYREAAGAAGAGFDRELGERVAAAGLSVRRAHGDFGPSNIFQADHTLWVLDWEESAPDAPTMTDEITFDLGINARRIAADPVGSLRDFARRRLTGASDALRTEIMLALAFRAAVGTRDARLFIHNWATLA